MKPTAIKVLKTMVFIPAVVLLLCASGCEDGVDSYIKEQMEDRQIPGIALTIIENGKRIKSAAYGYANLEWMRSMTEETVFEIGSITKQFTAAGILLLEQDGKLSVEDKISKYMHDTPASWSDVRIRHLLSHTSGIVSYTGMKGFELTQHLTQERFIEKLGQYPLEFQPEGLYKYSNSGYNLLGFIIENVSSQSYWDFMQQRIFDPLGMMSTRNREPGMIIRHRASGYEKGEGGPKNRDYDITDVFSAGALVSTLDDMAKWDAALDGTAILSQASKDKMWTETKLRDGTLRPYGFGWRIETLDGHKNIGHRGSTSGFSASIQRFPDDGLTVILFANSGGSDTGTILAKNIAKIYLKNR